MKKTTLRLTILITILALILPGSLVGAANLTAEVPVCEGTNVSGTIVAIDENGVITIDTNGTTAGGLCTVTISGDETQDHPIVLLLGAFFGTGDPQASDYSDSLAATKGCAVDDGSGNWSWADCSSAGAVAVQVLAYDEATGLFTAVYVDANGVEQTITFTIADTTVADPIKEALTNLIVDWAIEGGDVVLTGEQIAAYHDSGLGFGVLVKLYAMAQAAGVPVEELVAQFQAGVGMGELFKLYGGKPALTGVGHVRQQTEKTNNGNANGKANEKSQKENKSNNGKAKGKNK